MCKSLSKASNHTISHMALAMERYSTSAKELEIVCYLLDFQETSEFLMNTQKPLIDFWVSEHDAKSE